MITDGSGAVVGTQDHLPFGEDAGVVGENEKHRFTNYERDSESGTDYAVNRLYSTVAGRFMRPDPVAGGIGNPQSLNRYSYVMNDPINLSDPLGLFCLRITHHYSRKKADGTILLGVIEFTFCFGEVGGTPQPIGGFQGRYPFLGNNPFPKLTGSDLEGANEALKTAKKATSRAECDQALKDAGIPSLDALIAQLKINDNVFDGRKSTIGLIAPSKGAPRPTIADHFTRS
jgi:RHS repeat-associated protein